MFKLRKGCIVDFVDKLDEGYEINDNFITANISSDKIQDLMANFISWHDEPMFFILELPSNKLDEKETKPGFVSTFHNDVYYMDGCAKDEAMTVLFKAGEILINDGTCQFGFGCYESQDEIMFNKYNVTTIYSNNIDKFSKMLDNHHINKVEQLITPTSLISNEHPGKCLVVETNGLKARDVVSMFEPWGIYKAEQRED